MVAFRQKRIDYRTIYTGQHRETVDELMSDFSLPRPDHTLYDGPDITRTFQVIPWAVRVMWNFFRMRKRIVAPGQGNIFLVHGDTLSTVLGALMGRLTGNSVGHLESGLRSFRLFNPFPEELQRLATFALSKVYFCPGQWALNNLRKYSGNKVDIKYNTLIDSLHLALSRDDVPVPEKPARPYCIVSIHRYENISRRASLIRVIQLIERAAERYVVVFILHPPTIAHLNKFNLMSRLRSNPGIELRQRYSYVRFIKLLVGSEFIITDGGSNQEESSYLGHPCLLMRSVTERIEGLKQNVVVSDFRQGTLDNFISRYQEYRRPMGDMEYSPSAIVAEYVQQHYS